MGKLWLECCFTGTDWVYVKVSDDQLNKSLHVVIVVVVIVLCFFSTRELKAVKHCLAMASEPSKPKTKIVARWYFGGLGSAGAACCTHPLDLLKVSFSLSFVCLTSVISFYSPEKCVLLCEACHNC